MLVTALTHSLPSTGQRPTQSCPMRRYENSIYLVVRRSSTSWCRPTVRRIWRPWPLWPLGCRQGGQRGQREALFGGRGMFADFCYVCMCVAAEACDCGWSHLWRLGCRCTPISHVAVPRGGGVAQLWHWGGSVRIAACLSDRTESARARRTFKIWAHVCGTVSVTRRSRLQVESLCMFLCCFELSKPSTFTCAIQICALRRLKISFPPPNRGNAIGRTTSCFVAGQAQQQNTHARD